MSGQMQRTTPTSLIGTIVSVALIPVLWWVALDAIPPLSQITGETSGNRLGPWVFTWALVWIASGAALFVAWLSYRSSRTVDNPV